MFGTLSEMVCYLLQNQRLDREYTNTIQVFLSRVFRPITFRKICMSKWLHCRIGPVARQVGYPRIVFCVLALL